MLGLLGAGVWFGLTEAHGTGALVRSILEGVAYELRACLDILGEMAVPVSGILAVGGGARSALWTRLFADITEREVRVPRQTDAASLGAMLLAAAATGTAGRVEEAARSINAVAAAIAPDPAAARRYREGYARYNRLYEALRPTFEDPP